MALTPEQIDQMRDFADATHALRASHGQAPAHNTVSLSPLPNPAHNERVYGGHGNEIVHSYYTEYQMREYARQEVFRAEEAWQARAPADSVLAPAGGVDDAVDAIALARYKVVPSHESMFHRFAVVAGDGKQQLYLGREVECENMARKFAGAFLDGAFYQSNSTPTPPAQAADSVLEDAARLERERICAVIKAEDDHCVEQGDYMLDSDDCIKIVRGEWMRPDFSVDAARKQGEKQ